MAISNIGVAFEELFEQMRLFATQINDFPKPAELAQSQGASTGVTRDFHATMEGFASDLATVAAQIRKELEETEVRVRASARDMAETDAAVADSARMLLEQLEGIAPAPQPAPNAAPNAGAAPQGQFK